MKSILFMLSLLQAVSAFAGQARDLKCQLVSKQTGFGYVIDGKLDDKNDLKVTDYGSGTQHGLFQVSKSRPLYIAPANKTNSITYYLNARVRDSGTEQWLGIGRNAVAGSTNVFPAHLTVRDWIYDEPSTQLFTGRCTVTKPL